MDMNDLNGPDDHLMFWADLSTAIAYYTITSQLLLFVYNPKVNQMPEPDRALVILFPC